MTVYETLALLFQAGIFFVATLRYIDTKNTKK
ncbi:MAG: putative holin-like toxin [Defluviitaleaceae bacterium]|nr:putative holin-like toxin [Defluviitaleaceae bacterium]